MGPGGCRVLVLHPSGMAFTVVSITTVLRRLLSDAHLIPPSLVGKLSLSRSLLLLLWLCAPLASLVLSWWTSTGLSWSSGSFTWEVQVERLVQIDCMLLRPSPMQYLLLTLQPGSRYCILESTFPGGSWGCLSTTCFARCPWSLRRWPRRLGKLVYVRYTTVQQNRCLVELEDRFYGHWRRGRQVLSWKPTKAADIFKLALCRLNTVGESQDLLSDAYWLHSTIRGRRRRYSWFGVEYRCSLQN